MSRILSQRPAYVKALAFDHVVHEYRIDGRIVPSVTQVIHTVIPGWDAGQWYRQLGTSMHRHCEAFDNGDLDFGWVSPEIEGKVHAWIKFREESQVEIVGTEIPLASRTYGFAGCLDRLIKHRHELAVCDLKSAIERRVRLQLGGYSILSAENEGRVKRAVAVQLNANATYRTLWLDQQELRRAEQQFLACLTMYNFLKGAA